MWVWCISALFIKVFLFQGALLRGVSGRDTMSVGIYGGIV